MTRVMRATDRRLTAVCSALAFVALGLFGCGAAVPANSSAQSPIASSPGTSVVTPPSAANPTAPSGTASGVVATSPQLATRRLPEIALDPKQPLRPLPELKVENIGLHVGGGPNDAETKAPFLSAVAERFPSFMDCYRKNEDPRMGGRFGIDLHIARTGGHPRLEQPRTSLRGADFRACLTSAFETVDFQKPKKGPTTLSYSLRFQLVEAP